MVINSYPLISIVIGYSVTTVSTSLSVFCTSAVKAAKRFFSETFSIGSRSNSKSDYRKVYPVAIENLKKNNTLPHETQIRQAKYINNIIEQDHRFIKKRTNLMLGFKSFRTAEQTLKWIETMHMIKKGQVELKNSSPH